MEAPPTGLRWEHADQCRACGHIVRIDDIDAKVIGEPLDQIIERRMAIALEHRLYER